MLLWILIILLVLGAFGTAPLWPHAAAFGWAPSGGMIIVVIILLVVLLNGRNQPPLI